MTGRGNAAIITAEEPSPSDKPAHAEELHLQGRLCDNANDKILENKPEYVIVPAELPGDPACYVELRRLEGDQLESVYSKLAKLDGDDEKTHSSKLQLFLKV